jgi:hypothetical protein
MPKKKEKTIEQKEADVIDGYESWLQKRPNKKAQAKAGDVGEDEEQSKR